MCKVLWDKGDFRIIYSNPVITPQIEGDNISTIDDAMYFYYDVEVRSGDITIANYSAYDFPKVKFIHTYVDEIINFDMGKGYLLEDCVGDGFRRMVKYHQLILEDMFKSEYFYKFQRYDYIVNENNDSGCSEYSNHSDYVLSLGKCFDDNTYGCNVFIENLTKDDLLDLKRVSLEFCDAAIKQYNERINSMEIVCPLCMSRLNYVKYSTKCDNVECYECGHEFKDECDGYIGE